MTSESESAKGVHSERSVAVGGAVAGSVIVTGDSNIAIGHDGTFAGRDVVITSANDKRILSQDQAFERIGAAVRSNLVMRQA